jgi:hypothetical protein
MQQQLLTLELVLAQRQAVFLQDQGQGPELLVPKRQVAARRGWRL